jgi:hypothetical protein
MNSVTCEKCHKPLEVGDFPFCPHPHTDRVLVNGDDIPGGLEIKHGICNPDGTPKKYYSKSEIRKAAFEAGYTISGETPKANHKLNDQRWVEAIKKGRDFI